MKIKLTSPPIILRKVIPLNIPLNILGSNYFSKKIMNLIFKLMPLDIFSASASAIAIK